MKLELDPLDLKPGWQEKGGENGIDQKCNTRDITFEKFPTRVQLAIKAVGRAVFYAWDRKTYNAICPPTALVD